MAEMLGFLQFGAWPPQPDFLFWVAVTLLGGALLGELAGRGLGLPRIVGYSAAGMVVAAVGSGFGDHMHANMRLLVDLALGLLLFELGARVSLRWLRANPVLLATSLAECLLSFGAIALALHYLGIDTGAALACAALTLSTSGAIISRVATEMKSAGQVTERMIVLSALNTLFAVLALKLIIGWLYVDQRGAWMEGLAQTVYTFAGSFLLASCLAWLVNRVVRHFEIRDENTVLLLLGLLLLAITLARLLGLSALLVPLLGGVMLHNLSPRPCVWPRHFGTAGGVLVLMMFVVAGSVWTVPVIAAGALGACTVLFARGLGKTLVLLSTARHSGIELRQGLGLSLALSPMSATTLVLLADLQAAHPEFTQQVSPMVLTAVAAMALIGPIFVTWGLRLAGEHQPARAAKPLEKP